VIVPPNVDIQGREVKRTLSAWAMAGVRPVAGRWQATGDTLAALLAPDGPGGDAFVAFGNFAAIRRYNPSDYYALAVGLIGDQVVA
jgi:membrane-bound lytic murein transglycosylase B